MIQNKERLYLNVVKGLAIFLMMWGHCIQYCAKDSIDSFSNIVYQMIYSFHMPLFMLVSGYLFFFSFQRRELNALLVHRTQGMLQPIVFASILNLILIKLPTFALHGTISIFNGELFNSLYSLWFLWTVLSSSTVVAIVCKKVSNIWLQLICIALGVFFVALFPENHLHVYMYPYFVAGFYYGMYRERIPGWIKKTRYLSLAAFPLLLQFYERKHFIYLTPITAPWVEPVELIWLNIFRWTIGFVGSLFVLTLIWLLVDRVADKERMPRIVTMLAKLGENSLGIYCISVSLLSYYLSKTVDRILLSVGRNIFTENILIFNFVLTPLLAVFFGFALYGVVQLMKKMKLHKFVFGR